MFSVAANSLGVEEEQFIPETRITGEVGKVNPELCKQKEEEARAGLGGLDNTGRNRCSPSCS